MEHQIKPSVYYYTFGPNEPAVHVKPGDVVVATTVDAGGHDVNGDLLPHLQSQQHLVQEFLLQYLELL